jgi:hypothetical protein
MTTKNIFFSLNQATRSVVNRPFHLYYHKLCFSFVSLFAQACLTDWTTTSVLAYGGSVRAPFTSVVGGHPLGGGGTVVPCYFKMSSTWNWPFPKSKLVPNGIPFISVTFALLRNGPVGGSHIHWAFYTCCRFRNPWTRARPSPFYCLRSMASCLAWCNYFVSIVRSNSLYLVNAPRLSLFIHACCDVSVGREIEKSDFR